MLSKTLPKTKKIIIEAQSTNLAINTLTPVLPVLAPFLSGASVFNTCSVSVIFKTFYNHPATWRNLYLAHFGPLTVQTQYREQYIAAYHYSEALNFLSDESYAKLEKHIENFSEQSWTLFYKAVLAKERLITSVKPNIYAIQALRAGDKRAAEFLVTGFKLQIHYGSQIPIENLTETLKLLQLNNTNNDLNKEICLLLCCMFKKAERDQEKLIIKKSAIDYFFKVLNATDSNNRKFLIFFTDVYRLLDFITDDLATEILNNEIILNQSTVLGVLTYGQHHLSLPQLSEPNLILSSAPQILSTNPQDAGHTDTLAIVASPEILKDDSSSSRRISL